MDDTNTAVEAGGIANGTSGTNPTGNVLANDSDVDSVVHGETKTVTGVVAGSQSSAAGSVGSSVTGLYGSITIASDGSYTYTVDNSNPDVQALRLSGQTLSETFTYEMTDTGGLSALGTVTINIQGANDNPVSSIDASTATEASGYANATVGSNATGDVLANDTDVDSVANGETKTVTGVVAGVAGSAAGSVGSSVTGNFGAINLNADGSFTYVVDETNAAVQALRLNSQTITDVFTYTVTDTGGLTSTTQITVTIQGGNDAPVTSDDTSIAIEAGGYSNASLGANPNGNVLTNDTDVDTVANGETKTVTGVVAGSQTSAAGSVGATVTGIYGSITIASDGSYTYTVDNTNSAVQALRLSGQTLSETFTYEMTDTGGLSALGTVTINIQGANDAPVAFTDTNIAIEAGGTANGTAGLNPSGNVLSNDTDVDAIANGETKAVVGVAAGSQASASGSVGSSVVGNYGSLTIAADGSYTYTVDNSNLDVQALYSAADTLNDVFTYTMRDTAGLIATATVTITIQGVNDAPIAIDDSYSTAENSGISMDASSNDYELDPGDPFTITSVSIVSGLGNVQILNGEIFFTPGTNYDYLSVGETALVMISYEIQDAAGLSDMALVSLTIQGVRDALHVVTQDANAIEDVPFAFPISVSQVDTNGEQCIDVIIRGLPANTKMMDANGQQRLVDAGGLVSVFGMDLGTLSIELPRNYSGVIAVTIDVASNLGSTATQTFQHTINVEAQADIAQLNVVGGRLQIGQTLSLPFNFQLSDVDGSEVPTIGVRGLPVGIAITDGTRTFLSDSPDRWYDITGWRFDKLRLDSTGGVPSTFVLSYRLITTEAANNSTATVEAVAEIQIDAALPQQSTESNATVSRTDLQLISDYTSETNENSSDAGSKSDVNAATPVQVSPESSNSVEATPSSINVLPQDIDLPLVDKQSDVTPPADILRNLPADAKFTHLEVLLGNRNPFEISTDSMTQPFYRFRETQPEVFVKEEYNPFEIAEKDSLLNPLREEAIQTRAFSIQSSLIMFWNLLRSSIALPDNQSDSELRSEARPTLRVSRRDEEE
jgi:VCBS repeat-containing protein